MRKSYRACGLVAYCSLSVFLFSHAALASVSISQKGTVRSTEVTIEGVTRENVKAAGQDFTRLQLEGVEGFTGVQYQVGAPELPVVRMYVTGKVEVQFSETEANFGLPVNLIPSSASVPKIAGAVRTVSADKNAYESTLNQPRWTIEPAGSIRGVPQFLLTLFPVAYDAKTSAVSLVKHFQVTEQGYAPAVDTETPGAIAFVVGRPFANSPALAQYMDHKRSLGHHVELVVYGQDVTSIDGIRAKLKTLLTSVNLKYAILVGDTDTVPAKTAANMSGVTDHFYRAIDTANYDTDINGPDLGVGRISVRTEQELQNVVTKYIRYQNSAPFTGAWETQISFVGTSDSGFYQVAEGTHNYVIDTHTRSRGYVGNFPAARTLGGDTLYAISNNATGSNLKASIAEGRNFITYSGHGYSGGWAGPDLSSADVKTLHDPEMMPFVLGFACNTADQQSAENFAEAWQRHPFGAILYLGSVDSSYWDEDDILERRLFDGIFAGRTEFGDTLNNALLQHWAHYGGAGKSKYYWESYTTFGDPSISLRTGVQN